MRYPDIFVGRVNVKSEIKKIEKPHQWGEAISVMSEVLAEKQDPDASRPIVIGKNSKAEEIVSETQDRLSREDKVIFLAGSGRKIRRIGQELQKAGTEIIILDIHKYEPVVGPKGGRIFTGRGINWAMTARLPHQ